MGQSVVKSVFAVIVFWWLVLAAYGFFIDLDDLASLTGNSVSMALLTFLGVIFGLVGCWFYIWLEKRTKKAMLSKPLVSKSLENRLLGTELLKQRPTFMTPT